MIIRTDLSRFLTKAIHTLALILHLSLIELAFSNLAIINPQETALLVNITQEGGAGATIPIRLLAEVSVFATTEPHISMEAVGAQAARGWSTVFVHALLEEILSMEIAYAITNMGWWRSTGFASALPTRSPCTQVTAGAPMINFSRTREDASAKMVR